MVNMKDETMWLTQVQMTELFKNDTMTKFGNSEFGNKPTNYYN